MSTHLTDSDQLFTLEKKILVNWNPQITTPNLSGNATFGRNQAALMIERETRGMPGT